MLNRVLSEGFRSFFLLTLLAALANLGVWLAVLWADEFAAAPLALPIAPATLHWHGHEMIFGFAGAAAAGFFLTAVPNWTGAAPAGRGYILALVLVWLAGRGGMAVSALLPGWSVALLSLAFVPLLAAKVVAQLLHRLAPQNIVFLVILAALWAAQLLVQADWLGLGWGDAGRGLRAGVLVFAAMIAVIGGRVVPAFTRNAMSRAMPPAVPPAVPHVAAGTPAPVRLPATPDRLDAAGRVLAVAVACVALLPAPQWAQAGLAMLAGAATLARLARWRGLWAWRQPIVGVLHLAFGLLGLGYLVWGLAGFGLGDEVAALHLLAIGGVAGMVLAILSRASLGHSGRPLRAAPPLALAYALVPVAALLRWLAPLGGGAEPGLILASGGVWLAAFGLALTTLAPVLLAARAEKAR